MPFDVEKEGIAVTLGNTKRRDKATERQEANGRSSFSVCLLSDVGDRGEGGGEGTEGELVEVLSVQLGN